MDELTPAYPTPCAPLLLLNMLLNNAITLTPGLS
jgi:hypothetical protein